MTDFIYIGPSPPDEECVQVGTPDYANLAWTECTRYIQLLRAFFGEEPPGCQLKIRTEPHQFGQYMEVICEYTVEAGPEYALNCESNGPQKWTDVPSSSAPLPQE